MQCHYAFIKQRKFVPLPPLHRFDATWGIAKVSGFLQGSSDPDPKGLPTSMQYAGTIPFPRTIQSHLHWSLLPRQIREGIKKPKIIYVARNPKDLCVSYFHHRVLIEGYMGSLDEHVDEFVSDLSKIPPSEYFPSINHHDRVIAAFSYLCSILGSYQGVLGET
jgi:hypothetical protein